MHPPTIQFLTDIYFEPGALALLPDLLRKLGISRPLIVTDKGVRLAGLIDQLPIRPQGIFDDIQTNPSESSALKGVDAYRQSNCDGVVAVGGGSPIDGAKCVALLVTHPPPLADYALLNGGQEKITGNQPPVIAIPTTAGTGAEVGRAALITFRHGSKMAILSSHMIPDAVICDPNLTLALPATLTAATGMDAISHCVETYCSPRFNPVADAIALDGLKCAGASIRQAVREGSNLQVRSQMMIAALHGGLTFQKGLGAIHSLSHPLGGLEHKRLHHGTLNAIFLSHVIRFNMESCPQKMDRIAHVLEAPNRRFLPDFFGELIGELGLPRRLRDLGVTQQDLEPLVPQAVADHSAGTNPRPLGIEECRSLYNAAL